MNISQPRSLTELIVALAIGDKAARRGSEGLDQGGEQLTRFERLQEHPPALFATELQVASLAQFLRTIL